MRSLLSKITNFFTSISNLIFNFMGGIIFIVLFFAFRGWVFDVAIVPSESMTKTLCNGDFVLIDRRKCARLSPVMIPFVGRFFSFLERDKIIDNKKLERGDVIVFFDGSKHYTKRLIGLPGDIIEFNLEDLKVNGESTIFNDDGGLLAQESYTNIVHDNGEVEKMITRKSFLKRNKERYIVFDTNFSKKRKAYASKKYIRYVVPKGIVFVMGDNRDNSFDSRFYYFLVEQRRITGIIKKVVVGSNAKFAPHSTWLMTKPGKNIKGENQRLVVAWGQYILEFPYTLLERFRMIDLSRFNHTLGEHKSYEEVERLRNEKSDFEEIESNIDDTIDYDVNDQIFE